MSVSALILAGCASAAPADEGGDTFTPVPQDDSAEITVWVDSTRLPAAEAFLAANPDAPVKIESVNLEELQTKVSLFDKAGEGWPDVAFSQGTQTMSWAAGGKTPFAAPLDDFVEQSTIDNFAATALDPCEVDGELRCLRNDLAQNVFWFNTKLFDEFGYEVPTTWEEYEALGERVAAEHPGYVLGSVGDAFAPLLYFWSSQCPANQLDGNSFTSDLAAPECVRAAKMLDNMIANGSITTEGLLSTTYPTDTAQKTLALVGPSWFGKFVLDAVYKLPAGEWTAAAPLKWEADDQAYTGAVGGGIWIVSSHSKNLTLAAEFAEFVSTDTDVQASSATFPAYAPAAEAWLENPDNTSYFAGDVAPAFKAAASQVWSGWSQVSEVNDQEIWPTAVLADVLEGATVESRLPAWQEQARNLAQVAGYEVVE